MNENSNQEMKKDAGKIPLELIPEEALEEIAKVLDFGARKYSPNGWRNGMEWMRLVGAMKRHLAAWLRDDVSDLDPETGLNHLAHLGCCVLFLLTYVKRDLGTDDRWVKPQELHWIEALGGDCTFTIEGKLIREADKPLERVPNGTVESVPFDPEGPWNSLVVSVDRDGERRSYLNGREQMPDYLYTWCNQALRRHTWSGKTRDLLLTAIMYHEGCEDWDCVLTEGVRNRVKAWSDLDTCRHAIPHRKDTDDPVRVAMVCQYLQRCPDPEASIDA